ncbi:MAG: pentapeptide repeat-containing protein [Planctomycetota bacterium]
MTFERQNQRITARDILQAIANGHDIALRNCTVSGQLILTRLLDGHEDFEKSKIHIRQCRNMKIITLHQAVSFESCTFEENVSFGPPWAEPDIISVVFEKAVIFNSSVFNQQTYFRNAVFNDHAGFDGCIFTGLSSFRNVHFKAKAMFRTSVFRGYALVNETVFTRDAQFTNTHFQKGVNFANTKFNGYVDFSGIYSGSRSIPVFEGVAFTRHSYGEDETFWRFVKQAALEAGHYQLAGECFYNERCAQLWHRFRGPNYDILPITKKILRIIMSARLIPQLVLGRYLFGYGERPIRIIVAGFIIIVACGFYYTRWGTLLYLGKTHQPTLLDGLYFSTITFTTLGFGDLYPGFDDMTRYVAMAEALAGACLIAMFIVCLAKRFSRG